MRSQMTNVFGEGRVRVRWEGVGNVRISYCANDTGGVCDVFDIYSC